MKSIKQKILDDNFNTRSKVYKSLYPINGALFHGIYNNVYYVVLLKFDFTKTILISKFR
jgi:hypothetical protein